MVLAISLALASRSCSRNLSRSGSSFRFFFFFFFFLGCFAPSSGSPDGPAASLGFTVSSGLAEELPRCMLRHLGFPDREPLSSIYLCLSSSSFSLETPPVHLRLGFP